MGDKKKTKKDKKQKVALESPGLILNNDKENLKTSDKMKDTGSNEVNTSLNQNEHIKEKKKKKKSKKESTDGDILTIEEMLQEMASKEKQKSKHKEENENQEASLPISNNNLDNINLFTSFLDDLDKGEAENLEVEDKERKKKSKKRKKESKENELLESPATEEIPKKKKKKSKSKDEYPVICLNESQEKEGNEKIKEVFIDEKSGYNDMSVNESLDKDKKVNVGNIVYGGDETQISTHEDSGSPESILVDTDWDVEKYRNTSEPESHWHLKRDFMQSIKHMFDEAKVVCLGQVLGNMEFMGCQYPIDVMNQVEELGEELLEKYRSSRKGYSKRTFVSGSTAAHSKVNRLAATDILQNQNDNINDDNETEMPKNIVVDADYDPINLFKSKLEKKETGGEGSGDSVVRKRQTFALRNKLTKKQCKSSNQWLMKTQQVQEEQQTAFMQSFNKRTVFEDDS